MLSVSGSSDAHSLGCRDVRGAPDSVPLELSNEFAGGWVEDAYSLHETPKLLTKIAKELTGVDG